MTAGRVVHVVRSDAFAGVERYITDTATELSARGWDVAVIGGDPAKMRSHLPAAVEYRPAVTMPAVARQLLALRPFSVVHAHMTAAELPAAVLKARLGGRLIVSRHFAAPRGHTALGRLSRPLVARAVDVQVAISRFVADRIDGPSVVVHNGVVAAAERAVTRSKTVLVLQRLEPEKDTATALRAWALSGLAASGWRLLVHGHGSQADLLRRLADELGVTGSVDFGGFTDDPRSALRGGAILLATAPAEPFGLAVVEAMAEATPVLAAKGGAHEETLGPQGVYFTPGDAAGCADELRALAVDEDRRARLGEALQVRQRAEFSIGRQVDQLEQIYAS